MVEMIPTPDILSPLVTVWPRGVSCCPRESCTDPLSGDPISIPALVTVWPRGVSCPRGGCPDPLLVNTWPRYIGLSSPVPASLAGACPGEGVNDISRNTLFEGAPTCNFS